MTRGPRALLLAGIPLVLIGLTIFAMMLPSSDGQSSFDDPIKLGLPRTATRVMYYDTGFTDSSTWQAYTADAATVESAVKRYCGRSISELKDWTPPMVVPVSRPARVDKLNKGYWDVDQVRQGKSYSSFNGHSGVEVLVDTIRWRIFVRQYTT